MIRRKATIVFADGSKKMAHNLDDHNFRWYERKRGTAKEFASDFRAGIAIPHVQDVTTWEDWRELKSILIKQKENMDIRRIELTGQFNYEAEWRAAGVASYLIASQLSVAKTKSLELTQKLGNESGEKDSHRFIRLLERVRLLEIAVFGEASTDTGEETDD